MRFWKKKEEDAHDELGTIIAKGVEFTKAGKYDESESCFYDAMSINPQLAESIWFLTIYRNRQECGLETLIREAGTHEFHKVDNADDHRKRIDIYDKVLRMHPKNTRSLIWKGFQLDFLGRHDEAQECYSHAVKINPRAIWLLFQRSEISFDLLKYDEAISWLDKILKIDSANTDAIAKKMIALLYTGKFQDVLSYCDERLKINPDDVFALSMKGGVLSDIGKHDEAFSCFDKVLEIDPKNVVTLINKGLTIRKLGRPKEAINYFEKALIIDPKNADALAQKHSTLEQITEQGKS